MAIILIRKETVGWKRACHAEIITGESGEVIAQTSCGETITDRGHFEDTIQAAEIHVDQCPL